ncbi:hypothetical protein [Paenibacillus roseipurpureus]|uniref:Uncharacterized protein n=1 Tax=Paenibacillus roseopurpureus TaxID=2918901 RepID=A0AA96LKW3_9BACL|nr:hypothetical protein [Paenibacillus sp. MBLB1832]WNR42491.1 hypothetical protein MJB10_15290 [Paenibacillus sp. MBLB1832]
MNQDLLKVKVKMFDIDYIVRTDSQGDEMYVKMANGEDLDKISTNEILLFLEKSSFSKLIAESPDPNELIIQRMNDGGTLIVQGTPSIDNCKIFLRTLLRMQRRIRS